MADFIKIGDDDKKILYVNRDFIESFAYHKVKKRTIITPICSEGFYEVDGDITHVILGGVKK